MKYQEELIEAEDLSELAKTARLAAGLNKKDWAAVLDVGPDVISKWETGSSLKNVAKYLNGLIRAGFRVRVSRKRR